MVSHLLFRVLPANVSRPYHLLAPSEYVQKEVEAWKLKCVSCLLVPQVRRD